MKPVVDLVAGARPNFMKVASVVRALAAAGALDFRIVHTGQRHDEAMPEVFFAERGSRPRRPLGGGLRTLRHPTVVFGELTGTGFINT